MPNILLGLAVLVTVVLLAAIVYAKKPAETLSEETENADRSHFSKIRTTVSMWRD